MHFTLTGRGSAEHTDHPIRTKEPLSADKKLMEPITLIAKSPGKGIAPSAHVPVQDHCTPITSVAAIFDVDGVIADTARFHTSSWARLTGEEGLPFDSAAQDALRGLSREDSLRHILGDRKVSSTRFAELLARKNAYYLAAVESLTASDVLPGVGRLIRGLRELGLKIAAVSASRNARLVLTRLGISEQLGCIVDGNDQDRDPAGRMRFRMAADLLGVSPSGCIVFEDAASAIRLAQDAGMKTVSLGISPELSVADLAFESLCGVDAQIILKWLKIEPPTPPLRQAAAVSLVARP